MTTIQNTKPIGILEEFKAEFRDLLKKYDFKCDKISVLLADIRHQKTFQLRDKYNKFNLVKELYFDSYKKLK